MDRTKVNAIAVELRLLKEKTRMEVKYKKRVLCTLRAWGLKDCAWCSNFSLQEMARCTGKAPSEIEEHERKLKKLEEYEK